MACSCFAATLVVSVLVPTAASASNNVVVVAPMPVSTGDSAPTGEAAVDTTVYTIADFERFAPRTALDMVEKIPDFTLTETSDERGLGQASQNILVNGQRVAGKSNDARTTLARIAASAVERIEIVDGARLGIPGLTGRVANVIVRSDPISVQFRWEGQNRRNIPDQISSGTISASGRIGSTDFTLSLSNGDATRRGGVGPLIATDGSGALLYSSIERDVYRVDSPRLAGSIHREGSDGSILNINLSGQVYHFTADFESLVTPTPSGTPYDEHFRQTEREWNVEAGGDYEFALGDGRLKLIGLQIFEHSPVISTLTTIERVANAINTGTRFDRTSDEGESVLRAEYGWGSSGSEWQLAIEGAYNFLDITSAFGAFQPDGQITLTPLPGGDTFVDEWRAEALLTRQWTFAGGLSLQTTLGGEYSRIRQTSAGGLSRSFLRPKGGVSLAWAIDPRWSLNASIERRVGQLSFFDFSAAIDLNNGVASAANVSLVPEQTWRTEAEIVRSLGSAGSLTLGGYHEWISDIVDRIPINATEEGIGNLPQARRWAFTGRGTVLLDSIGWHGGRINASGEFRRSQVRDPLTGENRRISGDLIRRWSIDFRHDVPRSALAWGWSLSQERTAPIFRLDQFSDTFLTQPIATVFVEHKDVGGLTVRLALRNVLDGRDELTRTYYVDRRNGPVDLQEFQIRNIHLIGVLTISGAF